MLTHTPLYLAMGLPVVTVLASLVINFFSASIIQQVPACAVLPDLKHLPDSGDNIAPTAFLLHVSFDSRSAQTIALA
jgi:hypothetical protein